MDQIDKDFNQAEIAQILQNLKDSNICIINVFNILDQVFSKPFIEYFKAFAQQIEPSDDLAEWRLLYGGPKFLLTADKDVIFALSQMSQN